MLGGYRVIKGVNRQVVDVLETGSEYFERALFFVKPEFSYVSEGKLRENARQILKNASAPPSTRTKRGNMYYFLKVLKYCAAAAGGAAATLILSAVL